MKLEHSWVVQRNFLVWTFQSVISTTENEEWHRHKMRPKWLWILFTVRISDYTKVRWQVWPSTICHHSKHKTLNIIIVHFTVPWFKSPVMNIIHLTIFQTACTLMWTKWMICVSKSANLQQKCRSDETSRHLSYCRWMVQIGISNA